MPGPAGPDRRAARDDRAARGARIQPDPVQRRHGRRHAGSPAGTGFLRTLVLVAALGAAELADAYNNANTLPNTVYYLMLGGIFTAVVVPLLVRAAKEDPDRGEAYAQRMFTLGVGRPCWWSPWWRRCWPGRWSTCTRGQHHGPPGSHRAEHHLMVMWAYYFIPQIFFYGMRLADRGDPQHPRPVAAPTCGRRSSTTW